jgi:3-oxoacyl-(acyl-carrier-protein) synthase
MARRRVVVTGIGVVTPFGHDVEGFGQALLAGRSCVAPITRLDTSDFPVHFGGQVADVAATPFLPASLIRRNDLSTNIAFGDHAACLAVSANKSMLGHTMGASGALELVSTLLTLRDGFIPPTINYQNPDPACDLDYVPNQARRRSVRLAIKNSFAFGGENAVLVVRKPEELPQ